MRLIHTSDWHLGHTLHEVDRTAEHGAFLTWLLQTIDDQEADGLLISGDVFDGANPSAAAQNSWFRFLTEAWRRFPGLDIVVIGGNHDSAARLDAPNPLSEALGIRVVGGLPRRPADRTVDLDRLLCPLHDAEGQVVAWVVAVPFLRPADLPRIREDDADPLIAGVRAIYTEALDEARARREPGQAILVMGHLYMTGTAVSELSERKVLGGNQHALPHDLFGEDITYGALGHLHLAQTVGRESVRYCGSPIPLSLSERSYRHQVVRVDIEGDQLTGCTSLFVPGTRDLPRIPKTGFAPIEEVRALIALLPDEPSPAEEAGPRPLLEVAVRLDEPRAGLRQEIEDALKGKWARLARITPQYTGTGHALADQATAPSLDQMSPEEVFRHRYRSRHDGEPGAPLLAAFHEALDAAQQEGTP